MKFASNKLKLARAIGIAGTNATEEQVMAEYIKIGGLINKGYEPVEASVIDETIDQATATGTSEEPIFGEATASEEETSPKKRVTSKK